MPGVDKIGYTDSYGGLISATEARALSKRGKEEQIAKRWKELLEQIKLAALAGKEARSMYITYPEICTLRSLGYTVTRLTKHHANFDEDVGFNLDFLNTVDVSWHSPPSETKTLEGESLSSAGEDVADTAVSAPLPPGETL